LLSIESELGLAVTFGVDVNLGDMTIRLPGGGTMWFKSGDKPDSLYGEDVAAAVIDEATRCKEEVFHAVRSTLTADARAGADHRATSAAARTGSIGLRSGLEAASLALPITS
jgi:hypothetical protein